MEHTNAWLDAFMAVLIRFQTNKCSTLESPEYNGFLRDFTASTLNNFILSYFRNEKNEEIISKSKIDIEAEIIKSQRELVWMDEERNKE